MTPSADDLDRMSDREARAVWAAEAVSLRERLNDALAEVRAIAESDAEHVAMMQAEHDRRVEAEAEVRRITADNERMRRGIEVVASCKVVSVDPRDCPQIARNLLAGREWSNSADGAEGESK